MVFTSLLFTFVFLPIIICIYFLAKEKYRNYILLVASLLFYTYGERKFVFCLIASIAINYFCALEIDRLKDVVTKSHARSVVLIADLALNIGLLFVFKYLDFSIGLADHLFHWNFAKTGIALPIGISFFTFQAMSYVIDVYRGGYRAQRNPLYLALYIMFFPQLVAGPIVRYSTIEDQIEHRSITLDKFADGARRFMLGFSKKVLIANNLAVVATQSFGADPGDVNPMFLWMGAISYSLQIFFDFSGYSDMAIGLGKIFGFTFEENFNYPYVSKSVTEFWRRWHISLGQWFRDYVYIPLGGSKVSVPRHLMNMLIVWILTGVWHGANTTFVAWGLGYFILLAVEKYLIKPEKRTKGLQVVWQFITLLCVNFGWVIFDAPTLRHGVKYCLAMLGIYNNLFVLDDTVVRYFREYGFYFVLGVIFSTPIVKYIRLRLEKKKIYHFIEPVIPIGYGIVFLWSVSFIILGAHNPFIYFNF